MSQINNNGVGNTGAIDQSNSVRTSKPANEKPKAAKASGNSGTGVAANVGQALVENLGEVYNPDVIAALAKANSAPSGKGLTELAMKTIFGSAYDAAKNLLPERATTQQQALLAGAFVDESQM